MDRPGRRTAEKDLGGTWWEMTARQHCALSAKQANILGCKKSSRARTIREMIIASSPRDTCYTTSRYCIQFLVPSVQKSDGHTGGSSAKGHQLVGQVGALTYQQGLMPCSTWSRDSVRGT